MLSQRKLVVGLAGTLFLLTSVVISAPPTPSEIARRVQQLGDSSFRVREEASQFLWEAGKAAEPALREALKSDDPEVVRRAREILDRFRWGIYPDTPRNIVELINRYRNEPLNRQNIVRELSKLGVQGYMALFKIAANEEVEEFRQALLKQMAQEVAQMVKTLTLDGSHAAAAELIELSLTTDAPEALRNYAAYHLLRDQIDVKIAHFRSRLEQTGDKQAAAVLAYLHRARGDLASARAAAERADNLSLLRELLFEMNDWKALAAKPLPPEVSREALEVLAFQATIHRLAGDNKGFEDRLAEVRKFAKGDDDSMAMEVAKVLLVNELVDEALEILRRLKDLSPAFDVLCAQLRYREAMELVEKAPQGAGHDLFRVNLRRGRVLQTLGEKGAAARLFAQMGEEFKNATTTSRFEALIEAEMKAGLTELAFEQSAWMLPRLAQERSPTPLLGHLFPKKEVTADVWWQVLRQHKPQEDAADSFRMLRRLLAGQLPLDEVQPLLGIAEKMTASLSPAEKERWLVAIAEVADLHQRRDEARSYFDKAVQVGATTMPGMRLGTWLAQRKDWAGAAAAWGRVSEKARLIPGPLYLRGWALTQAGQETEGRRLMELAHFLPLGNEVSRYQLAGLLADHGLKEAALREREITVRTGAFDSWYTDDPLRHVAHAALMRKDFGRAADAYERYLLHALHANRYFVDSAAYLIVPGIIHRARSRVYLAQGKVAEALREADACLRLLPGDVEMPLLVVPELARRGLQNEADRIFRQVADRLEQLCRDYPQSSWAHNSYAWLAACCRRELDKALAHAQKAVELAPNSSGLLDTLAEVHFQRGDRDRAIALMKKCLEMEPTNGYFRKQLERFEKGDRSVEVPDAEPW
ncbi:MAG: hypothetical protein NZ700_05710 [Gemmataceae bacterium]|nr:hypothetical protein [Gemmataceae bacterium]MDW8264764.1 hypothetical protein [Gemmataceae bacterium]